MNLTLNVEPQISLEQLATAVNRLRKTVIDLDSEQIPTIINGYLQHFQIPLTVKNSQENINLVALTKTIENSKFNLTMKERGEPESRFIMQGTQYTKDQIDQVINNYKHWQKEMEEKENQDYLKRGGKVYIEDSLDISGSGSQSDQFQKQFYRQKRKQPNKNYEWNEEDHKNFLEAIEKFKD